MNRTRPLTAGAAAVAAALALTACGGSGDAGDGEATSLSVYIDSTPASVELWDGLTAAYAEENPDVTIEVETHPGGSEGDNLVKTRLATGEMNDLFWYNSGSLFQALKPDQNLVPLGDEDWVDSLDENFATVVSTDQGLYGAPVGASFAGAVIYNKDIYADLGLEVPTTWDDYMANNQAIKDAGLVAVAQSYGDTWTSQVPVLGDFYNVEAAEPGWADAYTAGDAKFVDQPALAGFEHLQEVFDAGLMNEDFASATYDDAVRMLAEGQAAHYPMLTGNVAAAIGENYPDAADSLGVFPLPSSQGDANGLTVWMPNGIYLPKTTEGAQLEAAKEFIAWLVTPDSCAAQAEASTLGGPFVVDGCDLPDDVPALVSDMQPYFDSGDTGLALEFLSPVKGPALEQITVEVGSGIRSAEDGAALYDEDVVKQAQQLGLDW
ncbi:extracellular solute-binding protein [Cellulomonas sp. ACRRI]|uniref:ABC transporter substrate-binding protein n=1 Tax=Cellulomonas sp. ACRRI TaxID=2918188 RepID=UPI001EF20ECD|nr:extracellular solute-binding protein [Cellulomonas sp. ACRRI]MCG7287501.1 extracellular solute-binding protein [Cellulomonas sp. ACRRI]